MQSFFSDPYIYSPHSVYHPILKFPSPTVTYLEKFQHIIPYEKMDNEYRHNLFDGSIIYASCGT